MIVAGGFREVKCSILLTEEKATGFDPLTFKMEEKKVDVWKPIDGEGILDIAKVDKGLFSIRLIKSGELNQRRSVILNFELAG